jgi:hypothetical protein
MKKTKHIRVINNLMLPSGELISAGTILSDEKAVKLDINNQFTLDRDFVEVEVIEEESTAKKAKKVEVTKEVE